MKDTDLIPELKEWKEINDESFSIEDWTFYHATPELFIGLTQLIWPKFIEHEGCIFFEDSYDEKAFENWCDTLNNDHEAVQKVMNHRHIVDYFLPENQKKLSGKQVKCISNMLIDIWTTKINHNFPKLKVKVDLLDYDKNELDQASVSFWTIKEKM